MQEPPEDDRQRAVEPAQQLSRSPDDVARRPVIPVDDPLVCTERSGRSLAKDPGTGQSPPGISAGTQLNVAPAKPLREPARQR